MRLLGRRRRPPARDPLLEGIAAGAKAAAQRAQARSYGEGIAAGIELTLRAVLGEPIEGGEPYGGYVPPELERWARGRLENVGAAHRAIDEAVGRIR